jgi:protein phosphatase 4 regulatory subunit 3
MLMAPFDVEMKSGNNSYLLICELLSSFVKSHGYRIKNFILKNNIIGRIFKLISLDEKYLNLAAIRFFKACICLGDIFYHNHIIQNDLFSEIFKLFSKNRTKFNLINSSILDIFEIIRKENMKKLINYLNENYENELEQSSECEPILGLISMKKSKPNTGKESSSSYVSTLNPAEIEDIYFNEQETSTESVKKQTDDEKDDELFPEYMQINLKKSDEVEDELEFVPEGSLEKEPEISFKIDDDSSSSVKQKNESPTNKRKLEEANSPNKKVKVDVE